MGGAELGNDFVTVRDQHGFAGPDQADVLGEAGLELLYANRLSCRHASHR